MRFRGSTLAILFAALAAGTSCSGPTRQQQHAHLEKILAKEGYRALSVGDAAPQFTLEGTGGVSLSIPLPTPPADPLGGWTVLFFFPVADAPNSAKHLGQLSKEAAALTDDGLAVYGVSTAGSDQLEALGVNARITVPLLSDVSGATCKDYGCLLTGGRYPQRTTVLISSKGEIALYLRGLATTAELREAAGVGAHVEGK